ncbi:MAG: phytoene/squalene synthase family protein [Verrucomicrobiae bacterium]|nr:phytoene/squalene synthase family protein [Verrucomicrobiae bacterium]
MEKILAESYAFCCELTKREAGNFYYSFLTLPRDRREGMCAIYAWMRRTDDLADDAPSPVEARKALEEWRRQTHLALEGDSDRDGLWPAFGDVARRNRIPSGHFDEIIAGALMDQEVTRYATFADLYKYCYRVASVVGLVSLKAMGCRDPRTEVTGEALGAAFQLTNILRDVKEDAARGRIYLPLEDLRRHGVIEEDMFQSRWTPAVHDLFREFAGRAEEYYVKAQGLFEQASPEARPTLRIMEEIYHGILERIRVMDYRVFDRRARVPTWQKLWIVARHQLWRG